MLSGLYGLSPDNRKHFGLTAKQCKPVSSFPYRLHLAMSLYFIGTIAICHPFEWFYRSDGDGLQFVRPT